MRRAVYHMLSSVISQSLGGPSTYQNTDIPKCRLGGLVQDVGHLVLKVLSCDQRVQQPCPLGALVDSTIRVISCQ